MSCVGMLVKYTFGLCIGTKINVVKPEQREDNSSKFRMGQSKFSYELKFCFISIENSGK